MLSVFNVGPSYPVQPLINRTVVTFNTATVFWTVPQVTYSPENYTILYGLSTDDLTMTSSSVIGMNTDFILATNVQYNVSITGLSPSVRYYCLVQSNNTVGKNTSIRHNFWTKETGTII